MQDICIFCTFNGKNVFFFTSQHKVIMKWYDAFFPSIRFAGEGVTVGRRCEWEKNSVCFDLSRLRIEQPIHIQIGEKLVSKCYAQFFSHAVRAREELCHFCNRVIRCKIHIMNLEGVFNTSRTTPCEFQ